MESLYGVQMRDKGVIVWEGRKCHADWHHHSQHWICPSAPTTSYKPSCKDVPDGYKERKHSKQNVQHGKIRDHPKSREQEAEGKKTEAAFTIFTSNKTLQRTILIAQVKTMDRRGISQGGVDKKDQD